MTTSSLGTPGRAGTRAARTAGTKRRSPRCALLLTVVVAFLAGCGGDEPTALAIDEVQWRGTNTLVVTTECATDVEVEVGVDHGGSGLPEVTLWGWPSMGRCHPELTVSVPVGTTRIVDGTTSLVIDLPATPT